MVLANRKLSYLSQNIFTMRLKFLFTEDFTDKLKSFTGNCDVIYRPPNASVDRYFFTELNSDADITTFMKTFGEALPVADEEWPADENLIWHNERCRKFTKMVPRNKGL